MTPAPETETCRHDRAHILDSRFYGSRYCTPETRAIFCDLCRYQRWLSVEAALAECQAELGLIPAWAARSIAENAHLARVDLDGLETEIGRVGHSLVPLLRALADACGPEAGEYVHYGATTQDIQDTAQSLEAKAVLELVDRDLRRILHRLMALAERHRDTLMVGRSHAKAALPMTFGLKVAGWIDELLRSLDRLESCRERVLVVQLFGGVGTMAALCAPARDLRARDSREAPQAAKSTAGSDVEALRLVERFAERLGLSVPLVAWHAARDRVAEILSFLGILTGTLGRIADEIRCLSRSEIDELSPGYRAEQVGSSTMPHKRNPEACEQVVVLARLVRAKASLGLDAMLTEHERDGRTLRLEWAALADAAHHACAALSITCAILESLEVNESAMAGHALRQAAWMASEALMLELARRVGRQTAHRIVHGASWEAARTGRDVVEILSATGIPSLEPAEALAERIEPRRHLGLAGALVDRALAAAGERLAEGIAAGSPCLCRETR